MKFSYHALSVVNFAVAAGYFWLACNGGRPLTYVAGAGWAIAGVLWHLKARMVR